MVKESERKQAYHERAAHGVDCICVVCRQVRSAQKKAAVAPPPSNKQDKPKKEKKVIKPKAIAPPPPPIMVSLDVLQTGELFELDGLRYRVGERTPEVTICHQLAFRSNGPGSSDSYWMVVKTKTFGYPPTVKPLRKDE